MLDKSWWRVNWFVGEGYRHHYFLAPARLVGGRIELPAARLLHKDGWDASSRFAALPNSNSWLRTTIDLSTATMVALEPRRKPRRLARMDSKDGSEARIETARALTRSGKYLLLVDDRELRRIDTTSGEIVERSQTSPLLELRRVLYAHLGSTGTWWLTEDLRYVIVAPSDWEYAGGAKGSVESTPLRLFGVDFNLQTQGLIYDRTSGSFSPFALEVQLHDVEKHYRTQLADAESVDGEVRLLYDAGSYGPEKTPIILTPQLDGRGRCAIRFRRQGPPIDFCWRPQRQRLWLVEPDLGPRPSLRVHVWDTSGTAVETYELTQADIERSIRAAR